MVSRAQDWLKQAVRDLEQAEDSRSAGRHEWACFAAQQAAKKTTVGLYRFFGQRGRGDLISKLLQQIPQDLVVPIELIGKSKVLDSFYIPSRYPNSHPSGAPFEHYGPLQSDLAINYAREILEFVDSQKVGEPHTHLLKEF